MYLVPGGCVPGPRGGVPGLGGVPGPRGVCTWSQGGVYLVQGGGVPGPGRGCTWSQGGVPGLGGCTWSRGVYLVPGGVPGPGGCQVLPL